jgi:hypothetical protein
MVQGAGFRMPELRLDVEHARVAPRACLPLHLHLLLRRRRATFGGVLRLPSLDSANTHAREFEV